MSLIERAKRLDVLYLAWDRAYVAHQRRDSRKARRRVRDCWKRYVRLRYSAEGLEQGGVSA